MKTITTISLDVELLAEARKRSFVLSKVLNDFLRSYLEMKKEELPEDRLKLEEEVNVLKAGLAEAESKLEKKKKKTVWA